MVANVIVNRALPIGIVDNSDPSQVLCDCEQRFVPPCQQTALSLMVLGLGSGLESQSLDLETAGLDLDLDFGLEAPVLVNVTDSVSFCHNVRPNTNALFDLLFGPNKIGMENIRHIC